SVLLALPLAGLDLPDAMLAWNLIALAAFLASLTILAAALPGHAAPLWLVVALLPFCPPVLINLHQGQPTMILLLLVTASWALDRSGRPAAAGALVGLAAAIKLFPAYLVVYFVARRRGRALISAGATFAALNLATLTILGPESFD